MEQLHFIGPMIRQLRLQRNWSQQTLCEGICAVSYLSKIELGKAAANHALITDLLERFGVTWHHDPETVKKALFLRDELYDAVFTNDPRQKSLLKQLNEQWDVLAFGPYYLDFMILRDFIQDSSCTLAEETDSLLNPRQACLVYMLRGQSDKAYRIYPCAFSAMICGSQAYHAGRYTAAQEMLQRAYDLACQQGYVYIMMLSQTFIANCYSDLQSFRAMERHYEIAARLARSLNDQKLLKTIQYNIFSTRMELGEYQSAYEYFSALDEPEPMELHKLAICCEKLGYPDEALEALVRAEKQINDPEHIHYQMCAIVRCRLENSNYLHDEYYETLLTETFQKMRRELPMGYARFHLPWMQELLTANRQYRQAYELLRDFTAERD